MKPLFSILAFFSLSVSFAQHQVVDLSKHIRDLNNLTAKVDSMNTSACSNIGFESGNMNGWTITSGTNIKSSTMGGCCLTPGGTVTVTSPGFDTSCVQLQSPLGGTKFVKINDAIPNSGVTRISYAYPVTTSNTLLEYAYQFMSQRSNHICDSLGYMNVTIYDASNNVIANSYVTGPKTSGTCSTSPTFTGCVYYPNIVSMTDWKRKAVSLLAYVGSTVTIEVTVADCTKSDHYAYGFFDARCSALDITCNNLDFEAGNFNTWNGYHGYNVGSSNMFTTGTLNGNTESVVLTGGTDPNKGFSLVSPLGGKVARINGPFIGDGNGSVNLISRTFSVTSSNANFQYAHLTILENCNSLCNLQTYFNVSLYDQNGNSINNKNVIANGSSCSLTASGFTLTPPFYFNNWQIQTVNLSAYIGQLVTIEFSAGDCVQVGHRGYSYFDTNCGTATGIESIANNSEINIWPNPFSDVFNVSIPQSNSNNELIIYDVTGKLILKKTLQNTNSYSLQNLSPGLYFYKILKDNLSVKSGKLVKE
jgi:hypothetical protein